MKRLLIASIVFLLCSAFAQATLNDLVMGVGQDQASKLLAGIPEYQQAAEVFNVIQNPKSAITGIAMQQVCSSAGQELCQAYSAISNPASFVQGWLVDGVCASDKQLCDAYNKGMQVYSAVQDPVSSAKMYALQEVAKKDPKIGGMITQAFIVKCYMDTLLASPAGASNDAATAAGKPVPKPVMPTSAAVAGAFEGKFAQESISSCLFGFSLGESVPQIGDIKNCRFGNDALNDISFVFSQENFVA